ncbi:MAG: hypothetical protein HC784_14105 [Hydrococcus sp. CSU_1_8]|nr:hypothetical protein [Hydrococcus sp. CSU_1_8]
MSNNKEATQFVRKARENANISNTDKLGALTLISVGIGAVSIIISLGNFLAINSLASKPIAPLVQLENGRTIKVAALKDNERTPQTIKNFASLALIKMMSWTGALPPTNAEDLNNPKPDPGVAIPIKGGETIKVPTSAWRTSFALSEDFQNPFLQELGKLYKQVQANSQGRATTRLEILNIGEPIQIESGVWKVSIVAFLTILSPESNLPKRLEFNKDISVQAIPVPPILEVGKTEEINLSQLISEGKAPGLQIFKIGEMRQAETKPNTSK